MTDIDAYERARQVAKTYRTGWLRMADEGAIAQAIREAENAAYERGRNDAALINHISVLKLEAERDELKERYEKTSDHELQTAMDRDNFMYQRDELNETLDTQADKIAELEVERDELFVRNFSYKQHLRDLIQAAKPHIKGNRQRVGREVPSNELISAIEAAEKCLS